MNSISVAHGLTSAFDDGQAARARVAVETSTSQARDLLTMHLANGPQSALLINEAARELGIKPAVLDRARKELGIQEKNGQYLFEKKEPIYLFEPITITSWQFEYHDLSIGQWRSVPRAEFVESCKGAQQVEGEVFYGSIFRRPCYGLLRNGTWTEFWTKEPIRLARNFIHVAETAALGPHLVGVLGRSDHVMIGAGGRLVGTRLWRFPTLERAECALDLALFDKKHGPLKTKREIRALLKRSW